MVQRIILRTSIKHIEVLLHAVAIHAWSWHRKVPMALERIFFLADKVKRPFSFSTILSVYLLAILSKSRIHYYLIVLILEVQSDSNAPKGSSCHLPRSLWWHTRMTAQDSGEPMVARASKHSIWIWQYTTWWPLDRDRYDESYRNRDRVMTSAVTGPVGYGAGVGAAKDLKPGKSTARVIHWRLQKTTARSTQNLSTP
jgi:hypothetical protein